MEYEYPYSGPDEYLFEGFYAAVWGIISGPIGISLSYRNNFSQSKRFCLWRAYMSLVTVTILGSIVGFSINLAFMASVMPMDTNFKALFSVEAAGLIGEAFRFYYFREEVMICKVLCLRHRLQDFKSQIYWNLRQRRRFIKN